jgi:hypothetical protein
MGLKPKIRLPKIRTKSLIKIIPGNIDSNWYSIFRGKTFSLDQLKTRMHKSAIFLSNQNKKRNSCRGSS